MTDDQAELRKCWRRYHTEQAARSAEWGTGSRRGSHPSSERYSHELTTKARRGQQVAPGATDYQD